MASPAATRNRAVVFGTCTCTRVVLEYKIYKYLYLYSYLNPKYLYLYLYLGLEYLLTAVFFHLHQNDQSSSPSTLADLLTLLAAVCSRSRNISIWRSQIMRSVCHSGINIRAPRQAISAGTEGIKRAGIRCSSRESLQSWRDYHAATQIFHE